MPLRIPCSYVTDLPESASALSLSGSVRFWAATQEMNNRELENEYEKENNLKTTTLQIIHRRVTIGMGCECVCVCVAGVVTTIPYTNLVAILEIM